MTTYPWRAALTRWGDGLFRLALLLTDDRTAAERVTISAFTRSFATANEDPETALYATLLQQKQRRRNPLRRRSLPRALDRIAPTDRVLLGAWLLRDIDGPRLLAIAGQPAEAVLPRLAAALQPFLDVEDTTAADPESYQIFQHWLRRRLGLAPNSQADMITYDRAQTNEWQAAIDELRQTLREAVGRQHLPTTCIEQIEIDMLEPQSNEQTRWWRQRTALIGAGLVMLALIWIVKPWQQGLAGPARAPLTSKELVQKTLDGWTTAPITGTLHQKVVAIEPRLGQRPLITDVWLSGESAQHRVEVRNDSALIEWQIGDDKNTLSYAAFPRSSSCDWAVEASVLDQTARIFSLSAEEQRAARDAALMRGAYGQGYQALQAALAAPDLRSFGTRIENKTQLLVLGYSDHQSTPERKLLLWIDPAKLTLHAVREVADAGGQSTAHDLWRLETSEVLETRFSTVQPSWPGEPVRRERLLDPRCPGLDPDHILSLRSFMDSRWWSFQQWYLPAEAPKDTKFAAFVTQSMSSSGILDNTQISTIFVGPDRWLNLQIVTRDSSPATGIERGNWLVSFNQPSGVLRGSACRRFTDTRSGFCVPSIRFKAEGWTQEELLTLIESFRPLDGQAWLQYNDLFLDPQPITAEAQAVLEQSVAAIQQLKQGSLYSVAEQRARIEPDLPKYQDPYHIPLELRYPDRVIQEQWLDFADTQIVKYLNLARHPRGDLLSTQVNTGEQYSEYYLSTGTLWSIPVRGLDLDGYRPITAWLGEELLFSLLSSREPFTVRQDNGSWLLEQSFLEQPNQDGWFDDRYISVANVSGWIEDLTVRTFVRRIWIDPATSLPLKTAIFGRDPQGNEIEILSIDIRVKPQRQSFSAETFSVPDMTLDTITFQYDNTAQTTSARDSLEITVPTRVLMWRDSSIQTLRQLGTFDQAIFTAEDRSSAIYQATSASTNDLDRSGLMHATRYRILSDQALVVVRQGPSSLLRYLLRNQSAQSNGSERFWVSSKALSATVAGEQRTVWLLEDSNQAMLVFEIDDLLIQVLGDDPVVLEQSVLPALSKLEWAAPIATSPTPTPATP